MTQRGPPLPLLLKTLGVLAGPGLAVGLIAIIFATIGQSHPVVGFVAALYLGLTSVMMPIAGIAWLWEKAHPGCFDEIDARDALTEAFD